MIPTACSAAMPSQTGAGALASAPSTALPMESSSNRRRQAYSSSVSAYTAPIIQMGDFPPRNACVARLRRLSPRLARSCRFERKEVV